MFSSSFFSPEFFGDHFKITTGEIIQLPDALGGGSGKVVDFAAIRKLNLDKDDQDILEFIVAYVISQ